MNAQHGIEAPAVSYDPAAWCTCGRSFDKDTAAKANVALGVHIKMANDKIRREDAARAQALIEAYAAKDFGWEPGKWLNYGFRAFGELVAPAKDWYSDEDKALAILDYFAKTDYQPTTDPRTIVSVTLRRAS